MAENKLEATPSRASASRRVISSASTGGGAEFCSVDSQSCIRFESCASRPSAAAESDSGATFSVVVGVEGELWSMRGTSLTEYIARDCQNLGHNRMVGKTTVNILITRPMAVVPVLPTLPNPTSESPGKA